MTTLLRVFLKVTKCGLTMCAIISLILLESCSSMDRTHYDEKPGILESIDDGLSDEISKINELHDQISDNHSYTIFHIRSTKGDDITPCYMESFDDALYITFGNYTPTHDFILKMFLDCEEVEFIIDDVQTDGYVFSLEREGIKTFKVKIVTDKDMSTTHELVTAIMFGPNTHVSDLNASDNKYGIVDHSTLSNDNCEKQEVPTPNDPDGYLDISFQGIMIGNQLDKITDAVYTPPIEITVEPEETVRLSYHTGHYTEGVESVAMILMLDWQPVQFQGKDFIHIKNDPKKVSYGILEITAPKERGKYELTSFAIADPYGDKWPIKCDLGYRITLTVE